tara:strand:+ start:128 stop:301 length:174 start_codon:yes stop_codon:yes gene_type:complete
MNNNIKKGNNMNTYKVLFTLEDETWWETINADDYESLCDIIDSIGFDVADIKEPNNQ